MEERPKLATFRSADGATSYGLVRGERIADLAPLFPPEPDQGVLVRSHDDPRVGAADEMAATGRFSCGWLRIHGFLR